MEKLSIPSSPIPAPRAESPARLVQPDRTRVAVVLTGVAGAVAAALAVVGSLVLR